MRRIFKLKNHIKHYDWGSFDRIPQLLGADNREKVPWAELWMGIHPEGPSETEYEGKPIALSELIRRDPLRYLGAETERCFGTLPFLFKLLAAGKPLSIQAHPSLAQAQAGFERENQEKIPFKAWNRNYKDPNHKPEILCALQDFRAMGGFREPAEIALLLDRLARFAPRFLQASLTALSRILTGSQERSCRLRTFFKELFALSPEIKHGLSTCAQTCRDALLNAYPEYTKEWEVAAYCAELYPGDAGVIAPLYLNVIDLGPRQAIYIPAGILHAYISGFGVELMANSDNVLRGGLTSKHIDLEELLRILNFDPFNPAVLGPQESAYPTPCKEFALSVLTNQDDNLSFLKRGPAIVMVTQGKSTIHYKNGAEVCELEPGESAFIPASDTPGAYTFSGDYTLYAAGVGDRSW